MARNQPARNQLERQAVNAVLKLYKASRRQGFCSPFDVIHKHKALEVKALSSDSKDLKIHIANSSLERKLAYCQNHNKEPLLIAVVISENQIDIYRSELVQSIRVCQMRKIRRLNV
jgi:hypothetical protein